MWCRHEAATGVAIVRPPGHHAESNNVMGFCFFNNAAIAARAAQVCSSRLAAPVSADSVLHAVSTQLVQAAVRCADAYDNMP